MDDNWNITYQTIKAYRSQTDVREKLWLKATDDFCKNFHIEQQHDENKSHFLILLVKTAPKKMAFLDLFPQKKICRNFFPITSRIIFYNSKCMTMIQTSNPQQSSKLLNVLSCSWDSTVITESLYLITKFRKK